jgi:hypothetical protein
MCCAILRSREIAQERQARARHAHHQVELAGVQTLDESQCFAMIVQRAFLNRGSDKRVAPFTADQDFHFFRAPAFQTEDF